MSGLFPSIANSQNVDLNGQPQTGAELTVYQGGTTTLAACFQDIGLAIPAQNPMKSDATNGRLPLFYVADGVYRVRLIDSSGVLIYDYPQVASIGASSSGGGGSAVDPTTIFQTGDPIWLPRAGVRTGWVRMNGRTIGPGGSGASERAAADCQALFLEIWTDYPDAKCPVVGGGGRGGSALGDWNAGTKQITLPDMRGKGPFGLDGMGNSRANVIPDGNVQGGDTGDTADATGGAANEVIANANLPANIPINDPQHAHNLNEDSTGNAATGGGQLGVVRVGLSGSTPQSTSVASTGITVNPAGANTALAIMNPFTLGTWYIKL